MSNYTQEATEGYWAVDDKGRNIEMARGNNGRWFYRSYNPMTGDYTPWHGCCPQMIKVVEHTAPQTSFYGGHHPILSACVKTHEEPTWEGVRMEKYANVPFYSIPSGVGAEPYWDGKGQWVE